MQLRKLDPESPQDVRKFVTLPEVLYQGCPQWTPPIYSEAAHGLNQALHPFYRHSTAEFFVVESEGQALGRVAALHNTRYNAFHHKRAAFFSQFDAADDRQAARLLFEAVYRWAIQQGCDELIGPRGLIGFEASGILVDGFDRRPVMGEGYNFPYYHALFTDAGLEPTDDLLSGVLECAAPGLERARRAAERVKRRGRLAVQSFDAVRQARPWIAQITANLDHIFWQQPGYYPASAEELTWTVEMALGLCDAGMVKVLLWEEQAVGFILAHYDVSAAVQKSRGRLWPLGWYYLLQERKRTRQALVLGMGIMPAYRNLGGDALLYVALLEALSGMGIERVAISQVDAANRAARAGLEALGIVWTQRRRLYRSVFQ